MILSDEEAPRLLDLFLAGRGMDGDGWQGRRTEHGWFLRPERCGYPGVFVGDDRLVGLLGCLCWTLSAGVRDG